MEDKVIYKGIRQEENKFPFDVLVNDKLYRAVYKDGYMQVIEENLSTLEWTYREANNLPIIQEVPDDVCEKICELVENWFNNTPNKAWWKKKKILKRGVV